jgi:transcriptional regulator with XRE-family HTH domain
MARMNDDRMPFGVLLRRWRQQRRLTQMDLAISVETSTRHLSFIETGRAQPGRGLVMRLCEHLDIPLRARNALLLGAGFAPAFRETSLAHLTPAREAIERVLMAHKPYPAFAIDRQWNIVASNRAIPQLYTEVSAELLRTPVNAMRLTLHPGGLAPRIVNFAEWRAHQIAELRRSVEVSNDAGVAALLAEVLSYPAPHSGASDIPADEAHRFATPLQIATPAGVISFLSTTTVFGTPLDVTVSELALEMLLPADGRTIAIVEELAKESPVQAAPQAGGQ